MDKKVDERDINRLSEAKMRLIIFPLIGFASGYILCIIKNYFYKRAKSRVDKQRLNSGDNSKIIREINYSNTSDIIDHYTEEINKPGYFKYLQNNISNPPLNLFKSDKHVAVHKELDISNEGLEMNSNTIHNNIPIEPTNTRLRKTARIVSGYSNKLRVFGRSGIFKEAKTSSLKLNILLISISGFAGFGLALSNYLNVAALNYLKYLPLVHAFHNNKQK